MYPSGSQIRAARALLNWSRDDLAARSGVSARTINNIENSDRKPIRATLEAVMGVLIAEGVRFVPADPETGKGAGVVLD